jgi:ADP-ribose pyrophosphatase YjhB (NUDIX family)
MSPRIKAAVLVRQDSRFLLVQEKGPPTHGLWNWPQGRVEEGEAVEEAAVREAKEETGFDLKIEKTVAILEDTFADIKELHVYLATIVGGEMTLPDDEILDPRFFSVAEVEQMKERLVGQWILDVISQVVRVSQ